MYRHLLILPDGTELFSGSEGEHAIISVTVTELVNDGQELMPGSVCAAKMEATILTAGDGVLSLHAGDGVTLLQVDEENARRQVGIFYLEKPTRESACSFRLTGYDSVSLTDRDLTTWLTELDQWPYSVSELAHMVCRQCGVILEETELPNGDHFVQRFTGEAVTGRKLLQWLGQVTGRFCHAKGDGTLTFGWYAPNTRCQVMPTEESGSVYYLQDSLRYADYTVCPVEKVQLRRTSDDVGTVYPNESGEKNTYIIENNPLLTASNATELIPVAQTLYEQMQQVAYTPGSVTVPAGADICPGDILTVTDALGVNITMYVMKKTGNGQTAVLECSGSHRRDSSAAVNNTGYRALSGKVLNLRTDVDGIRAENADTTGKVAALELDLEGIRSRVERQDATAQAAGKQISTLTQRSDSLRLELEQLRENGTDKVCTRSGYTFDDRGLHISRSDSQIENTLDHTGMYVSRYGQTILQANHQGVQATDVTVRNYLVVGDHARLEDFGSHRTACYYIG